MTTEHQPTRLRGVGDVVLPFVNGLIPAVMSDLRPRESGEAPAFTLILADAGGCSKRLASGLSLFGRTSAVVRNPLDAIVRLENAATRVDAAFVSLQDADFDIGTFFGSIRILQRILS